VKTDDQFAIIDRDRFYTRLTKSLDKQLLIFAYRRTQQANFHWAAQSSTAEGSAASSTGLVLSNSSSDPQFPQITNSPAETFLAISTSALQTGHSPMVSPNYSGSQRRHFRR
jgi:hypothetical protein